MADLKLDSGGSVPGTMRYWWKDLGARVYALVHAAVLIKSDGTELGTATNRIRTQAVTGGGAGGTVTVYSATGAAAIALSTAMAQQFRLVCVTVHLSTAPTTAGALTVTLNANDGAAHDTLLYSQDPSSPASTDIVWIPDNDLLFEPSDEIDVAYANANSRIYGVRIVCEEV